MSFENNLEELGRCHVCHAKEVVLIRGYSAFYRVTSDCRPWLKGGKLGVCRSCGFVQKSIDTSFHEVSQAIYDSYDVYHQSQGQEQRTFEPEDGKSYCRSELLLTKVSEQFDLPSEGCLLDIGCGNGNLLRSFSKLHPSWTLSGLEFDKNNKQVVEQIRNVKAFLTLSIILPEKSFLSSTWTFSIPL